MRLSLIIILAFAGWILSFCYFLYLIPKAAENINAKTDGIVVLTGGEGRIREGVYLLARNSSPKLLISGIGSNAEMQEFKVASDEMRLASENELTNKISLGYMARNTIQNALETSNWVILNDIKSLRLITSNYHIPRSLALFKHILPNEVKILIHPVLSANVMVNNWWKYPKTMKLLINEFHKYILTIIITKTNQVKNYM